MKTKRKKVHTKKQFTKQKSKEKLTKAGQKTSSKNFDKII